MNGQSWPGARVVRKSPWSVQPGVSVHADNPFCRVAPVSPWSSAVVTAAPVVPLKVRPGPCPASCYAASWDRDRGPSRATPFPTKEGSVGTAAPRRASASMIGAGPHRAPSEGCDPPVTVASKEAVALERLANWWAESTLDACQGHSDELAILASSKDASRGLRQIFAISAPSTLARHRGGWGAWLEFASASLLSPAAPDAGCLLDFLYCVAEGSNGSQRRSRVKSVSSVLQALRFVGGKLGCQRLLLACNANCITALENGKRSCKHPNRYKSI